MHPGGPLPQRHTTINGYEAGRTRLIRGRLHAMRPAGISEPNNRRPTLCGLLATPIPRQFGTADPHACTTCAHIQHLRPSARPVQPSPDLAAHRALLDHAAIAITHGANPTTILTQLLHAA